MIDDGQIMRGNSCALSNPLRLLSQECNPLRKRKTIGRQAVVLAACMDPEKLLSNSQAAGFQPVDCIQYFFVAHSVSAQERQSGLRWNLAHVEYDREPLLLAVDIPQRRVGDCCKKKKCILPIR